jgi:ferredoxin
MTATRARDLRAPTGSGARLVLDPTRCTGHGMCAELFPEQISLDDWGYPMIAPAEVPRDLEDHARRAVKACPVLALRLDQTRT